MWIPQTETEQRGLLYPLLLLNKQWMALLLSAGMAVTTCPVPGAQEPPAEQIHTEQAEESSAAVHSDDSDREGTAADEFQSETELSGSETETGAYEEEI